MLLRSCAVAFILLATVGCDRTVKHEVTIKVDELWRKGLTDAQAAAVQADKDAAAKLFDKLMGEIERLKLDDPNRRPALLRLKVIHDEFTAETLKANLRTAAPKYRKALEGKTIADLAKEQAANAP